MAEIHVQPRKNAGMGPAWIWILVVLLLVGGVAYYLMNRNKTPENPVTPATIKTSRSQPIPSLAVNDAA